MFWLKIYSHNIAFKYAYRVHAKLFTLQLCKFPYTRPLTSCVARWFDDSIIKSLLLLCIIYALADVNGLNEKFSYRLYYSFVLPQGSCVLSSILCIAHHSLPFRLDTFLIKDLFHHNIWIRRQRFDENMLCYTSLFFIVIINLVTLRNYWYFVIVKQGCLWC